MKSLIIRLHGEEYTIERVLKEAAEAVDRREYGKALELIAFPMHLSENESTIGQCAYIADVMVLDAPEIGKTRVILHPDASEHILEKAARVYDALGIVDNCIYHSSKGLLSTGSINLGFKFSRYCDVEFSKQEVLDGADAAFRRGWVHQGIEGYNLAGEFPEYDMLKDGLEKCQHKLQGTLPETARSGESIDRYAGESRKATKLLLDYYPVRAIEEGLVRLQIL